MEDGVLKNSWPSFEGFPCFFGFPFFSIFDSPRFLYVFCLFLQEPAKPKRGQEEGDRTENVINCCDVCRKLSWHFMTTYDDLWRFMSMEQRDGNCHRMSQVVVNCRDACRKFSWRFFPCALPAIPFEFSPKEGEWGRSKRGRGKRRNGSQKRGQQFTKRNATVSTQSGWQAFSYDYGASRCNYCAIVEMSYCATIASLPVTPFTLTPIPLLRFSSEEF